MSIRLTRFMPLGRRGIHTSCQRAQNSAEGTENMENDGISRELYLENQIVRLVLNAPKKRNSLSLSLMEALHSELKAIDRIEKVRAVILAGEGPAFSAGHNLKELTEQPGTDMHRKVFSQCTRLMQLIQHMQLPVIAEVEGVAAAAGCQLVSTCDVVVASENASFSVPGLKAGIFCSTPGIPLIRNVPRKIAMDMLLTARQLSAEEALKAGLVSRIAKAGEARIVALQVAEEIMKMSRSVTALGKSFFYAQLEMKVADAYR
jgi:enoyl-CoA hydratase/carnithine racemase